MAEKSPPPSAIRERVAWGVRLKSTFQMGSSTVYCAFPINEYEIFTCSMNKIALIEGQTVRDTAAVNLSCAVYVERYNVIVGITATTGNFVFIRPHDLQHPIYTDFRTRQIPTYHILCSEKADMFITTGNDIKVWDFQCDLPNRMSLALKPKVKITLRTQMKVPFDSDFVNPPSFDYEWDKIFLPMENGFDQYDMNGFFSRHASKLPATARTVSAYDHERKMFITADPVAGVCEWTAEGVLSHRHVVGQSSIVSVKVFSGSFLIYVDVKLNVFVLDTSTSKLFSVATLRGKPMSIFLSKGGRGCKPQLIVTVDSFIDVYDVDIPWVLWAPNLLKPITIERCPKPGKAARILVQTSNNYVSLISPKNGLHVTTATTSSGVQVRTVMYDRGCSVPAPDGKFKDDDRDQIALLQMDGDIAIFSTGQFPCEEVMVLDMKGVSMFPVVLDDKMAYCVAAGNGELVVCSYDTCQAIKRYIVHVNRVLTAYYDNKYGTVVMLYETELIRFDLQAGNIVMRTNMLFNPSDVFAFHERWLFIGSQEGELSMLVLSKEKVSYVKQKAPCHQGAITGFGFGTNFFMSTSVDCTLQIWSYSGNNICTVVLPLPLYGATMLNGYRDILVGTETEIMIIQGSYLFREKPEPEDEETDNYNKKKDELNTGVVAGAEVLDDIAESILRAKNRNEEDAGNGTKKRNRFMASLHVKKLETKKPYQPKQDDEAERKKRLVAEMSGLTEGGPLSARIEEKKRKEEEARRAAEEAKRAREEEARKAEEAARKEAEAIRLAKLKEEEEAKLQKKKDEEARRQKSEGDAESRRKKRTGKRSEGGEYEYEYEDEEGDGNDGDGRGKGKGKRSAGEGKSGANEGGGEGHATERNEGENDGDASNKLDGGSSGKAKGNVSASGGGSHAAGGSSPSKGKLVGDSSGHGSGEGSGGHGGSGGSGGHGGSGGGSGGHGGGGSGGHGGSGGGSGGHGGGRAIGGGGGGGRSGGTGGHGGGGGTSGHGGGSPTGAARRDKPGQSGGGGKGKPSPPGLASRPSKKGRAGSDDDSDDEHGDAADKKGSKKGEGSGKPGKKSRKKGSGNKKNKKSPRDFAEQAALKSQGNGRRGTDASDTGGTSSTRRRPGNEYYTGKGQNKRPEGMVWVENNGETFRPVGEGGAWVSSTGEVYNFDPASGKWTSGDGKVWSGPNSHGGRFAGEQFGTRAGLRWVDVNGVTYSQSGDPNMWIAVSKQGAPGSQQNGHLTTPVAAHGGSGAFGKLNAVPLDAISVPGAVVDDNGNVVRSDGTMLVDPDGNALKLVNGAVCDTDGKPVSAEKLQEWGLLSPEHFNAQNTLRDLVMTDPEAGNSAMASHGAGDGPHGSGPTSAEHGQSWGTNNGSFGPSAAEGGFGSTQGGNSPHGGFGPNVSQGGFATAPGSGTSQGGFGSGASQGGFGAAQGGFGGSGRDGTGVSGRPGGASGEPGQGRPPAVETNALSHKLSIVRPGQDKGFWVLDDGRVVESLGGRWIGPDSTEYIPTPDGYVASNSVEYRINDSGEWRGNDGSQWHGVGKTHGKWIEDNGEVYIPVKGEDGAWLGPDGKIYKKSNDGQYYGPSNECWQGPTHDRYIRKQGKIAYFDKQEKTLIVRPRASTPIMNRNWPKYVLPKRKHFPFRCKTPPPKVPRKVYTVPPPNIVVDEEAVRKLIANGEWQLLPVLKRLGYDTDDPKFLTELKKSRSYSAQRDEYFAMRNDTARQGDDGDLFEENSPPKPITEPVGQPEHHRTHAAKRVGYWESIRVKVNVPLTPIEKLNIPREAPPSYSPRRGLLQQVYTPRRTGPHPMQFTNPLMIKRLLRPKVITPRAPPRKHMFARS